MLAAWAKTWTDRTNGGVCPALRVPRMRERKVMKAECRPGVQNERRGCPKWGSPLRGSGKREKGPSGKYETGKYFPDFPDFPDFQLLPNTLCRTGVQNEGNMCPKWGGCSAVRVGRKGSECLSQSESTTCACKRTCTERCKSASYEHGQYVAEPNCVAKRRGGEQGDAKWQSAGYELDSA